jgi:hypothetical protein
MAETDSAVPIACNLGAFSAAEREHHAALLAGLLGKVRETVELPDGHAFRFEPAARTIAELGEWISLERSCCPFLRFALELEPNAGPVWLRLTGGPAVREFVGATFQPGRD